MNKETLINLLNNDLKNEYKHMKFYLSNSFSVTGLHREEYREYLFNQAKSEMEHVREFSEMIIGLGGVPINENNEFPVFACPKDILKYALQMELEVVDNYVQRIEDAKNLNGADGTYVEIFLEEQIMDSRKDADNLKQILAGC